MEFRYNIKSFWKTHNNCIARKQAAHQQEAIVPFFAWLKMKLEIGGKGVARGSGEILDNENQKQNLFFFFFEFGEKETE